MDLINVYYNIVLQSCFAKGSTNSYIYTAVSIVLCARNSMSAECNQIAEQVALSVVGVETLSNNSPSMRIIICHIMPSKGRCHIT